MLNAIDEKNIDEKDNNISLNKNVNDDSKKQINIKNNIIVDGNADNEKKEEKIEEKEENEEK